MNIIPYARRAIAASLLLAATALSHAASYSITTAPGWNAIANQLDSANGNGIRNVILNPPLGSQLRRFNLAAKSFGTTETFQQLVTGGGNAWSPGTNILNPGDGLLFFNPTSSNVVLTISGNPHVPALPLNIGTGLSLVARQTNEVALVSDILGFTPGNFTAVYRFITGVGHDPTDLAASNFTAYAFVNNAWVSPPGVPPSFRVGESVWITTNGILPVFRQHPASQTNCPGTPLILTVSATGTPPLSYQWTLNGNPISGAIFNSYTNPAPATNASGTYICRVTNPFGTVNSNPATVGIVDNTPPIISCPQDIVTSCRGSGGTAVQFGVGVQDNCDPAPTLTITPPSGSTFPAGTTIVTCVAKDATGNTNFCTFKVTVLDDISPQIVCPPDQVVIARDPKGAQVFFNVTATDNCDPDVKIVSNPPSGSVFPLGLTVVNSIARDSTGNSSTCTFNVIVLDASCCDGKTWGVKDVTSPGGRFGHVMAYDSNRGKVVMFGGENPNGILGDTWEWNGTTWTQIPAEGPAPRSQAAMTFDSRIGRVVMHGGRGFNGAVFDDTWLWDGSKWQRATVPSVGARYAHAMAFDSARGVTTLYGGLDVNSKELSDTWEFDGGKWSQVAGSSTGAGPLQGHAMAYGSNQGQMLLFGGSSGGKLSSDTWQWDGAKRTWNRLAVSGPIARAFHAMAYSDNCDAIVLFGGSGTNGTFFLSDTWEFDGKAWRQTGAAQPTPRGLTGMAHDSQRNQTVLFGGTRTTKEWLGDTWVYSLDSTPPQVVSVDAVCNENTILIAFNNPMLESSAETKTNYSVLCGTTGTAGPQPNPIVSATLTDDPRIVRLVTQNPISGCTLFIGQIQDACGRTLRGFQGGIDCRIDPCGKGSSGNDFWLTFPGNYAIDPANPPAPRLFITGAAGTIGTVSMQTPVFSAAFTIPAVGVTQVTLPKEADLGDDIDVIKTNGVHVIASKPVAVYGANHLPFTTDGYLGLSTRGIGKSYIVMAYGNLQTNVPELNGTQFAIAAANDNTAVIITPTVAVGSHPAGVPFTISLMKGQTYQLRGTNDAPSDLSGSIVVADQPISVFGGHRSGTIPTSDVFFADHLVEQLPPTDSWGQQFFTVPLATRSQGDTFRVMALVDGTKVTTNGVSFSNLINRGKFVEYRSTVAIQLIADKPVLVAQFANSSDYDGVANSDPFMVIVPPINSYAANYIVPSGGTNFASNFLNLVVPNSAVAQVLIDGAAVSSSSFSAIGASGFSGGKIAVGTAPHKVTTSSGVNFGLIAYGWSLYNAYGFPGGSCGGGGQITPPRFTCPPEATTVQAGADCLAPVPDLSKSAGGADQALSIRQQPAAGTLLPPGSYAVRLTMVDSLGNAQTCTTALTVTPSANSGLQCPLDIVTNCSPAGGQVITFKPTVCNTNFTVTSVPASGSVFPAGVTIVTCTAKNANGLTETCTFKVTVNCVTTINITLNASSPVINWSGSAILQQSSKVTGPWSTVPDATPPFTIKPTNSANYYRLSQ